MSLLSRTPAAISLSSLTRRRFMVLAGWTSGLLWTHPVAAEEAQLHVDFAAPTGVIRPLHGINKGPLAPGGMIDITPEHRNLQIPFTRLHDCGWPNPHVVDHHVVFPNPKADPSSPESYDFRLTDEYIAAVRQSGAEPIYRLGESIEHTTIKRYAHPPADMDHWAAVCCGIIRHYNEGWASGFRYGIRYWEIWNEPENRPVMWSGTDEDYLRLYRIAATAIQREFPAVKVGGPALGASGSVVRGEFQPTEFAAKFVAMCREERVPFHFFSWHCYTDNPKEFVERAKAIRRWLDDQGFPETESHLNEWNYLPGNTWKPLTRTASPAERQRCHEEMSGAGGAAFVVASLLELQDAPLDVANFFHGELGGFGLFNEHGVPFKVADGFRAFRDLLETPQRVETRGGNGGTLTFAAGQSVDGKQATILVANYRDPKSTMLLQWKNFAGGGDVTAEIRAINAEHQYAIPRTVKLEAGAESLRLDLTAPSVAVIRLRPTIPNAK